MTVPAAKLPSGVPGFDAVTRGGLPRGRLTLLEGARGTGKTIFALQVLAAGVQGGDGGAVFVAHDESPEALRRAALDFGWDIAAWEREGRWAFVDGVPDPAHETVFAGDFDLGALIARIEAAAVRSGARRVVLDSLDGLFAQLPPSPVVENELRRLASTLESLGATTLFTATPAFAEAGPRRVADGVIRLARGGDLESWALAIEVETLRGAAHLSGRHPVVVVPGEGIAVLAPLGFEHDVPAFDRVPSGNPGLDRMMGGGPFRDSLVLLKGPPGSGKSLLLAEFLAGGAGSGDRSVLVSFKDGRARVIAEAAVFAIDMERMEADRRLAIVCARPDGAALAEHLYLIQTILDRFEPQRVAVAGLAELARIAGPRLLAQGLAYLTALLRQRGVTGLLVWPDRRVLGGDDLAAQLATAADAVIVLRDEDDGGERLRLIDVLKVRGSWHERGPRAYAIDGDGLHIGRPWRVGPAPEHEPAPDVRHAADAARDLV